jgi:protease IV
MKSFFRFIKNMLIYYFVSIGIFVTIINIVLAWVVISSLQKVEFTSKKQPSSSVSASAPYIVTFDLKKTISERSRIEDLFFESLFDPEHVPPMELSSLTQALRRIEVDSNVQGLLFKLSDLSISKTVSYEVVKYLKAITASGKKIYVWADDINANTFEMLALASNIALPPVGGVEIMSPTLQLVYFAEALKRLGVEFEVIRAGKYKSAFEGMIQNDMSPETFEMYSSIQQSLRQTSIQELSAQTGKPESTIEKWLKRGLYTSQDALTAGIITEVSFYDDFERSVVQKEGLDHEKNLIDVESYLSGTADIDTRMSAKGDEGLGLILAQGNITMNKSGSSDEGITSDGMQKEIDWMSKEDRVKAVVLRVNSPGGSAAASDLIWQKMKELKIKKPVIVSMGATAASGGYYISAASSKILAEPTTITGSIGVIGALPKMPQSEKKYGLSFHTISTSDRKAMFSLGEKLSEKDHELIGGMIDRVYDLFLERVAEGRSMQTREVHELAQGRVYTGVEAVQLGLVDELGGLTDAYRTAKELAGFETDKLYPVIRYEEDMSSLQECIKSAKHLFKCLRFFKSGVEILSQIETQIPMVRWLKALHSQKSFEVLALSPLVLSRP